MARPQKNERGEIQRSNGNRSNDLGTFLMKTLAPQIRTALPKHLDGDRMARVALTAVRTTPKLAQCDRWSFAACIIQSAQLGLEVNTPLGHAYLIPRKGQVTLQLGYQGMIELARRSGQVSTIFAYTVHAGDTFEYELGLDPKLRHIPGEGAREAGNMSHVYAVAALKGSEHDRQFVVLTKAEVEARKARGAGGPAWRTDYLAMAKKTAVRALFTWLPKSPEMARATIVDQAPEIGQSTRDVVDAEVADTVEAMALPPPPEDDEEEVDPETGEVVPPPSEEE